MSLDQVNPERLHCLAQGRGKLQSLWKVLVYGQRNGDAQVIEMIMGRTTQKTCVFITRPCRDLMIRQRRGWGWRWEEGIGGGMRAKGHCRPATSGFLRKGGLSVCPITPWFPTVTVVESYLSLFLGY